MTLSFRKATKEDVIKIVSMLADDKLGSQREDFSIPLPQSYYDSFDLIANDSNNELMVAVENSNVIGTLQLTFIPYLTFKGGMRAQIEAVRVHKDHRSRGLGKVFFEWAINRAKEKKCHVIQLTTNKERDRAKDFYDTLGFEATHEGMKLYL